MAKKLGGIPVPVLVVGGLAVVGGGAYFFLRKKSTAPAGAAPAASSATAPYGPVGGGSGGIDPALLASLLGGSGAAGTSTATTTPAAAVSNCNCPETPQGAITTLGPAPCNCPQVAAAPSGITASTSAASATGGPPVTLSTGTATSALTDLGVDQASASGAVGNTASGGSTVSFAQLQQLFETMGQNPTEAYQTTSNIYNNAQATGGIVSVPGYGTVKVA